MRTAETILGIIQDRGRKGRNLEDVFRQLFNPDLYLKAYGRIYRNDGAMTRGSSTETVDGMSLRKIQGIIEKLRFERYRWTPVRRTYIEKKGSTKKRPLGIPTWSDKLLQEVLRSILDAYFEPQFSDHSHGFRPGRGCHTALTEVMRNWHGAKWFIEGDIKGCFDNIDHQVLLSILREKIHDNRFLILIESLLQAGYLEDWSYRPTLSGAPQGGIVSPILSNIYLDQLDKFVVETLVPRYTRGDRRRRNKLYRSLERRINVLKAKGEVEAAREVAKLRRAVPSNDPNDPDFRRLWYVRYADDFLLGLSGPKEEAEAIKVELARFLHDHLKLELSREKTLISHARTQPARFLGYEIVVMNNDNRRQINGNIDLRVPSDVIHTRCSRYMREGRPIHRPELLMDGDFDIVARFGSEYRGIVQFYVLASNIRWFGRLHQVMGGALLRTLAHKHRSTVRAMYRKYASTTVTREGKLLKCLEVTVDRPGKKPLVARFGGISLRRTMGAILCDELVNPTVIRRAELEERLLAEKCELCGSTQDVEVHHVRKLADLQLKGRREKPLHVRLMAARRRKTLVVCAACHDAIHAGRPPRKAPSLEVVTGEPDDAKVSRPVRRGADEKGPG